MTATAPPSAAEVAAAYARVDADFRRRYGRGLDAYDISDARGFWTRKEPCGGVRRTGHYFDPTLVGGRFASPYRTWQILHAAARTTA